MPDDSQSPLPFHASSRAEVQDDPEDVEVRTRVDLAPRAARKNSLAKQPDRVEISIYQPALDFSASPGDRAHPQTALIPVASLIERREAGVLDLFFLGLTYAGFLGLFHSLGGHLSFAKVDAIVYAVTFFLLYALYFSLFTVLGGATPGMLFRGLYVVRLDGNLPETRQLMWRSFGYLLSGGALLLGYTWSLWDEDRFTWHDRMSHTYVTAATPLEMAESIETPAPRQTFAHK
ncbi:MAG: RDD family protein [Candidatus Acidiferrales bacterium]